MLWRERFPFRLRATVFLLLPLLATSIITAFLWWAAKKIDQVAVDRQGQLVGFAISQLRSQVAHNQESSTVWDDAVKATQYPPKLDWIDANLGSWMHRYFRLDGLFVLRPDRTPIYAFYEGGVREASQYSHVANETQSLISRLQDRLRRGDTNGISEEMLSIGESDFAIVDGHPAVISVKPIISDMGIAGQAPGNEALHVAVRYLDGDFLQLLRQKYLLDDVRFRTKAASGLPASPLMTAAGETLGFFVWQPFRPGQAVFRQVMPSLIGCGLLFMAILLLLINVLEGRSTRLHQIEKDLAFSKSHDPVTGLPNRTSMLEELSSAGKKDYDVIYVDIDDFKSVNDASDLRQSGAILVEIGRRLAATGYGSLYHLDSDRFIMVMNRQPDGDLEQLCEKILTEIRRPIQLDNDIVVLSASAGVASARKDMHSPEEAIRRADIALYHAKAAGKGRFAIFGDHMEALLHDRRSLESDLRVALRQGDQFLVLYQPVYDIDGTTLTAVEALVRWQHPHRGLLSPDMFIPVAEETGGIKQLGEIVLERACIAALAWDGICLAVNASAIELALPGYAAKVQQLLVKTGFPAARLEIELTESAFMKSDDALMENINDLRGLGVRIALDDFGIGYSSLARLQQLPVDRLKIDKLFVEGLGRDPNAEEFLATIITLARSKGLSTTAEGIESAEQIDVLQRLGCGQLQGYLLGKPMAREAISNLFLD